MSERCEWYATKGWIRGNGQKCGAGSLESLQRKLAIRDNGSREKEKDLPRAQGEDGEVRGEEACGYATIPQVRYLTFPYGYGGGCTTW